MDVVNFLLLQHINTDEVSQLGCPFQVVLVKHTALYGGICDKQSPWRTMVAWALGSSTQRFLESIRERPQG